MAKKTKGVSKRALWLIVLAGVGILAAALLTWLLMNPISTVANFNECKAAGGRLMESYPEQCSLGGKTFTDDSQLKSSSAAYLGLSEQAALDKAESASTPARVVERDGESLPIDMSFAEGRLNLYIENGTVTRVVVEGE